MKPNRILPHNKFPKSLSLSELFGITFSELIGIFRLTEEAAIIKTSVSPRSQIRSIQKSSVMAFGIKDHRRHRI